MSRDDARRTLIAYDVPDDRRRGKLARVLEEYGDRVQYSVFVIDCSPSRLLRLKGRVNEVVEADEDSVLICDLGPVSAINSQTFSFLGRSRPITEGDAVVL